MSSINNSIGSYADFSHTAQLLQQAGKESPANVKAEDIQKLQDYLGTADARTNFAAGQINEMQEQISDLKSAVGQKNAGSIAKDIGGLVDNINAIHNAINSHHPTETGLKDSTGQPVNYVEVGTQLAAAAKADGAVLNPVKTTTGQATSFCVVKDKSGATTLYGGDGAKISTVKPGQSGGFEVGNIAGNGTEGFVKVSANGTAQYGPDKASVGLKDSDATTKLAFNGGYGYNANPVSDQTIQKLLEGVAGVKA